MTLQDEIRRRRDLGQPPLSAEEQRQFQQNLTDTAGRDLREAGRGSVKTTPKGTKVVDGQYKGLTKPQMEQAIITGAPAPTSKSGYVRGGPLTGGHGLPQRAPSAAPTLPEGGRMVPGRSTGSQIYVPAGEKAWYEQSPSVAPAAPTPAASGPVTQSLSTVPASSARPPQASAANTITKSLITVPASSARPPQASAANTITKSLITVPSLARPPMQSAGNSPLPQVTSSPAPSPRPQGMINGQPSSQFFQEAANRQGIANSYGTIKPQIAPPAPSPSAAPAVPSATPPPAAGGAMLAAKPAFPSTFNPSPAGRATIDQGPPKALAGPLTPPAAATSAPATPNGPRLSFGAPKFMTDKPVNGSPIADTMKNNQMIRPGFDKIIAAQRPPVPTAAMPPPPAAPAVAAPRIAPFGAMPKMLSSTPTARPSKTLQPPQLVMSR